ncbi:MAG: DUF2281 domain-containing protein [Ignavibacteriales bacterium CG_4_9_14_3_um_filter_30_11]|nr:MAG: DUF2281 domain-containing protein [Ignavibacteriales bacterium CG_4_9_14_3_um_filter_30_11]
MDKKELVLQEIEQVPDILLDEVLDFLRYLKTKITSERIEALITSESSLKKDWLLPEEDIAWQNL